MMHNKMSFQQLFDFPVCPLIVNCGKKMKVFVVLAMRRGEGLHLYSMKYQQCCALTVTFCLEQFSENFNS